MTRRPVAIPSESALSLGLFAPGRGAASRRTAFDDSHHVALLHDEKLFAVDLDLGAAPLAEQDPVAGLEVEGNELAAFVAGARAGGDHFAFLRLLLGGVGNDDAAFGLLFRVDAPDDDAIMQRAKLHGSSSFSNAPWDLTAVFHRCGKGDVPPFASERALPYSAFAVSVSPGANGIKGREAPYFAAAPRSVSLSGDLFPVAGVVAVRIDGPNRPAGDRALPHAAPCVDRVVAGRGHRDEVRAGIGAAIGARARQRPARVRLAAVQVGADEAGQEPVPGAAHEGAMSHGVDGDAERSRDIRLESSGDGNGRSVASARGAISGAARGRDGRGEGQRAEPKRGDDRACVRPRSRGHSGLLESVARA